MIENEYLYKIDESTPKNAFILAKVREAESLSKLALKIGIAKGILSKALNKKYISKNAKLIIAKFFNKDTIEIF